MAAQSRGADLLSSQKHFDRHRFDNYTSWLDREDRKKAVAEGRPLGYGYEVPKEPPKPREEKPFWCQEFSMTSGLLVNRKYDQFVSGYKTGKVRTDPYHEPNQLEVKDADHFRSFQRRIQHIDPRKWKVDPALAAAVSDDMVKAKVAADRMETRANIDQQKLDLLFKEDARPKPHTLGDLNVDLSCIKLPDRETGRGSSTSSGSASRQNPAAQKHGKDADRWKWCMGGRPSLPPVGASPDATALAKSQSVPSMGPSTLPGNMGGDASAFHGTPTRKFGDENWDGRMRGGKLARDGWAGTFPAKEGRPP